MNLSKQKRKYYLENKEYILKQRQEYKEKFPWKIIFKGIKQRCNNKNCKDYKYYGEKGIKVLITEQEIKELWFRDKAYLMKKPSIDRFDSNLNYYFGNCQFIEQAKNTIKTHNRPILQFDKQGNFIKEWESLKEASLFYSINYTAIISAIKRNHFSCNSIWKYKEIKNGKD